MTFEPSMSIDKVSPGVSTSAQLTLLIPFIVAVDSELKEQQIEIIYVFLGTSQNTRISALELEGNSIDNSITNKQIVIRSITANHRGI